MRLRHSRGGAGERACPRARALRGGGVCSVQGARKGGGGSREKGRGAAPGRGGGLAWAGCGRWGLHRRPCSPSLGGGRAGIAQRRNMQAGRPWGLPAVSTCSALHAIACTGQVRLQQANTLLLFRPAAAWRCCLAASTSPPLAFPARTSRPSATAPSRPWYGEADSIILHHTRQVLQWLTGTLPQPSSQPQPAACLLGCTPSCPLRPQVHRGHRPVATPRGIRCKWPLQLHGIGGQSHCWLAPAAVQHSVPSALDNLAEHAAHAAHGPWSPYHAPPRPTHPRPHTPFATAARAPSLPCSTGEPGWEGRTP